MLTVQQIKDTVTAYFKDKPVKEVYLFGSYARGEAKEESDVDLLFSLKDGTRISYYGLAQYLLDLEAIFLRRVDLVERDLVYPIIKKEIESSKVLLYNAA